MPGSRNTLDLYLNMANKVLAAEEKNRIDAFRAAKQYDSLSLAWDRLKRPDLASYYLECKAEVQKSASAWLQAGTRYYYAVPFVRDESEQPLLFQRAAFCLEQALRLDSSNHEARLLLASCFVESGTDPMKGIGMLRDMERRDSSNVKVQLSLGLFSVRSGQLDKALDRFRKVLRIDSNYIEVYLHLADVYEKMNATGEAIRMLETYQMKSNDPVVKLEVGKYIDQLKNSN